MENTITRVAALLVLITLASALTLAACNHHGTHEAVRSQQAFAIW